jgi:LuxR family transcriptional regulator, maltose regulon positive regulatory protein
MLLSPFLNDLARYTGRGILVLEDYHLIGEPAIHQAMTFFLDHLPATLHVVIVTRSQPPLPLARMRARGDLAELHAADLRFSLEETGRFFDQTIATALAPDSLVQIDAQLEGWGAGLRLLALALQGRDSAQEIERVLATFAGSHHSVLDYFVAEVLNAQPPHVQDFLLRTSVLNRLTAALCDVVIDEGRKTKDERSSVIRLSSWRSLRAATCFLSRWMGLASGIATTGCSPMRWATRHAAGWAMMCCAA